MDNLGRFMTYTSLIVLLLSMFLRLRGIDLIALILLGYSYFRMFSRNVQARYLENQKYLEWKRKFLGFFRNIGRRFKDKDHKYFSCPNCGQSVRVPKGKGNISIKCPKCGRDFIKRT